MTAAAGSLSQVFNPAQRRDLGGSVWIRGQWPEPEPRPAPLFLTLLCLNSDEIRIHKKFRRFKVSNSVTLGTFAMLCNRPL